MSLSAKEKAFAILVNRLEEREDAEQLCASYDATSSGSCSTARSLLSSVENLRRVAAAFVVLGLLTRGELYTPPFTELSK